MPLQGIGLKLFTLILVRMGLGPLSGSKQQGLLVHTKLRNGRRSIAASIKRATLPQQVPTLRQAVHWIARLGGFLDRPGEGEPGVTVLWKGFQHLRDLTAMYPIFRLTPSNLRLDLNHLPTAVGGIVVKPQASVAGGT